MESMRTQGGIQALLAAEQEAQQVVTNARNAKMARLKQAKEEAEREAAVFRAQLDVQHQNKIFEGGSSFNAISWLDQETEAKIQNLKKASAKVSREVVSMIMKHVTTVNI